MPLTTLKTYALKILIDGYTPDNLAKQLRMCSHPIVGRIKNESFLLDLRTIKESDFVDIKNAFTEILFGGIDV
jgi:L-seryl-tRNA(Ser) seleniumtransferase